MKHRIAILLLTVLLPLTIFAENIYLQTDFDRGIPTDFTVWDKDENPTIAGLRNISSSEGSFTAAVAGTKSYLAAVSSAYSTYNYPIENWLITSQIHIASADAILRWDAKSVHYDYRESYSVMISQNGLNAKDFTEVLTITEENYYYTTRALSLAEYVGKDIYIAFVHNSTKKFLLAIDNLVVGEIDDTLYRVENHSPVTVQGGNDVTIEGYIYNLNKAGNITPVCRVEETDYIAEIAIPCNTGDKAAYNFAIPTPAEGKVAYQIGLQNGEDFTWLASDTLYCSAFPRRVLVEEFTGTWCTSCPKGSLALYEYEHNLRDAIIPVTAHCNDTLTDAYYEGNMAYYLSNLPSFLYDRMSKYKADDPAQAHKIYTVLSLPVIAEVVIDDATFEGESAIKVASTVRVAENIDNSSDIYRISYIITENTVQGEGRKFNQSNNMTLASTNEFYYLPSAIPADIMIYKDVARGTSTAFTGIPLSLPSLLETGETYRVEHTIDIPTTVVNKENISVTAIILKVNADGSRSLESLNAYRTSMNGTGSTIATRNNEVPAYRIATENGRVCLITDNNAYAQVHLYGIDGRHIATTSGKGNITLTAQDYNGIAIAAITIDGNTTYRKFKL